MACPHSACRRIGFWPLLGSLLLTVPAHGQEEKKPPPPIYYPDQFRDDPAVQQLMKHRLKQDPAFQEKDRQLQAAEERARQLEEQLRQVKQRPAPPVSPPLASEPVKAAVSPPADISPTSDDCWRVKRRQGGVCVDKQGMEFVWVPEGTFMMGQSEREKAYLLDKYKADYEQYMSDEQKEGKPFAEWVSGFWMGRSEVTVGQFRAFAEVKPPYQTDAEHNAGGKDGCFSRSEKDGKRAWEWVKGRDWRSPGFSQGEEHPVVCVSWNDAMAFVKWKNDEEKQKGYALPTEMQWEYAARGETDTIRYWGDDLEEKEACRYANVADETEDGLFGWTKKFNCTDGHYHTAPVKSYTTNAYGLHDMLGNVWEWTCSLYAGYDKQEYSQCVSKNHAEYNNGNRVLRGGSWNGNPRWVRAANRLRNSPDFRNDYSGFRLVRLPQD